MLFIRHTLKRKICQEFGTLFENKTPFILLSDKLTNINICGQFLSDKVKCISIDKVVKGI